MTDYTFPLDGPISLQCRFGCGSLSVQARDGITEARVEVAPRYEDSPIMSDLVVTMKGSTLAVAAPRPPGAWFDLPAFIGRHDERDALDISVEVPSGTEVKAATFRADVTLRGRLGNTDLVSGNSSVTVDEIDGDLKVRAGGGPIEAQRVSRSFSVKSGASDIRAEQVGAAVAVAFGTGRLVLGRVDGAVRVRSGSASVEVGRAGGDVEIATGSGSLTVGIAPGAQARLDVVTGRGQLNTEMPVSQAPAPGKSITIRARTGNGDVTVKRAGESFPAAS